MTNEEIIGLLPSGAQARIAKQIGVSKQAVSKALKGQLSSVKASRIVKEATEQAEKQLIVQQAATLRNKVAGMSDAELVAWIGAL